MNTNLGDAGRDINQDSIKDNFNTFNQQFMDFSTKIENYFKDCKREFENKFSTKSDVQSLTERIESLEKRITELSDNIKQSKKNDNWIWGLFKNKIPSWLWVLISSIIGAILFILAMFFFQIWFGFEVSYENSAAIVLAFVGIAATFIVVSNYAQVQDIKREFEYNTKKMKVEFSTKVSDFQNQLQNIRDEFESHYIKRSDVPDVKVLDYKMKMLHSVGEGHIFYSKQNYNSYLANSMKALYYYNTINAILPYQLDGIVLFIKHLSDNTITISESEKESYLGIAYNYKGYEKDQLIQFIQNLQTS